MWSAVFPGQGSQAPGMGKFLWAEFPLVKQTFEEASDTLSLDFKKLCFDGSEAELSLTENTQPCLLLVSTATWRVLTQIVGFSAKAAAGHSIGEYAAVVAAQALPFSTALRAVRLRGQAMQSAVPLGEGGMTAVLGLELEAVNEICRWAERSTGQGPVQAANINAPGQIVISGKKSVLDWLAANFKPEAVPGSARAKFIPLKVSAPFHGSLMKPAEETMRSVLSEIDFQDAVFPIVQNVNAEPVRLGAELRENLIAQVSAPVRWVECVQKLQSLGSTRLVEVGSGRVLAGLVKKIDGEHLQTFNINSLDDIKALEAELKGS